MPKPMRTKPVSGAQVRTYAGKAQEYADAAASEVDQGRFIAATSLAVHAAINAAVSTPFAERASECEPPARTTTKYSPC